MYFIEERDTEREDKKIYGIRDTVDDSLEFIDEKTLRQIVKNGVIVFGFNHNEFKRTFTYKSLRNTLKANGIIDESIWDRFVPPYQGKPYSFWKGTTNSSYKQAGKLCMHLALKDDAKISTKIYNLPPVNELYLYIFNNSPIFTDATLVIPPEMRLLKLESWVSIDTIKIKKGRAFPLDITIGNQVNIKSVIVEGEIKDLSPSVANSFIRHHQVSILYPNVTKDNIDALFDNTFNIIYDEAKDNGVLTLPSTIKEIDITQLSDSIHTIDFRNVDLDVLRRARIRGAYSDQLRKKDNLTPLNIIFPNLGDKSIDYVERCIPEEVNFYHSDFSNYDNTAPYQNEMRRVILKGLEGKDLSLSNFSNIYQNITIDGEHTYSSNGNDRWSNDRSFKFLNDEGDVTISVRQKYDEYNHGQFNIRENLCKTITFLRDVSNYDEGDKLSELCPEISISNCYSLTNVYMNFGFTLNSITHCPKFNDADILKRQEKIYHTIGSCMFQDVGLTKIVIPKEVRLIDAKAFLDCKDLAEVEFEDVNNLPTIHPIAFEGTKVDFRNSNIPELQELGAKMHKDKIDRTRMKMNTELIIQATAKGTALIGIDSSTSQSNIKVPKGVVIVEIRKCPECVKSFSLPDTVKYITAVRGKQLKYIPYGVEMMDGVLTIDNYTYIETPSSIKEIAYGKIRNSWWLRKIKFNEGLEIVGSDNFNDMRYLECVEFPNSVRQIGAEKYESWGNMFEKCPNLKYIKFPRTYKGTIYDRIGDRSKNLEWVMISRDTILNDIPKRVQILYYPDIDVERRDLAIDILTDFLEENYSSELRTIERNNAKREEYDISISQLVRAYAKYIKNERPTENIYSSLNDLLGLEASPVYEFDYADKKSIELAWYKVPERVKLEDTKE